MPRFLTSDPELLDPGPTFDVSGEELDPAQRGYTLVHNYAHYFWRPYLGNTAFALWELLLSFCYGDHDTAFPSISRLARMLTNSDHCRAVVTGRASAPLSQSSHAVRPRSGRPARPAEAVRPAGAKTPDGGRGDGGEGASAIGRGSSSSSPRPSAKRLAVVCEAPPKTRGEGDSLPLPVFPGERVGVRGALALLRRERLVQVMQRGQGPTLHYTFRVLKSLPLLSPEQVQRLSPGLQRDHAGWLERYGIDPAAYLSAYASEHAAAAQDLPALPAGDGSTPEPSNVSAAASNQAGGSLRRTKNPYSESAPMNKLRQALLAELCLQHPGSQMRSQFGCTKFEGAQDGVLSVRVFNACRYDFLQHRLVRIVGRVLSEVTHGQVHAVHFVLDESVSQKTRDTDASHKTRDTDASQKTRDQEVSGERNPVSDRNRVSGSEVVSCANGRTHAGADGDA